MVPWREFQDIFGERRAFGLVTSGSHLCCLQMMWFCWLLQAKTFSVHLSRLQLIVKWSRWESALPSLSSWFSIRKRWSAPYRSGVPSSRGEVQVCWYLAHEWRKVPARDRQMGFVSSNEGTVPVHCGEEGTEPKGKALNLLFHLCSIFVPTLTYGHKIWVVTERMRSRIQAVQMGFLRMAAGLGLRDRVRSLAIRKGTRSWAAASSPRKESADLVQAFV